MTEQDRSEPPGGAPRGELVRAAPGSMREWAEQLVSRAREDGVALTSEGGLLTDLMRHVLQTGLEVEMAEHLGYERGEAPPGGVGNARNGAYDKTVATEIGEVELRIPRDRRGTFEPAVVPKYQRRLDGLAGNVISLYARGLTTGTSSNTCSRSTAPRSPGRRSRRSPTRSSLRRRRARSCSRRRISGDPSDSPALLGQRRRRFFSRPAGAPTKLRSRRKAPELVLNAQRLRRAPDGAVEMISSQDVFVGSVTIIGGRAPIELSAAFTTSVARTSSGG